MSGYDVHNVTDNSLPGRRPEFVAWQAQLLKISGVPVSIRKATPNTQDARRMMDVQSLCPPIGIMSASDNTQTIKDKEVLLAEVDGVHVGFCVASESHEERGPLFVQVIAVVPEAQRRGIGMTLLAEAANSATGKLILLATRDDNGAAHALKKRFAESIGATIRREKLGTYLDRDLGIRRGLGYRVWVIESP
jgi:ribosomal protein S18 acetylase RimI-like enzyme